MNKTEAFREFFGEHKQCGSCDCQWGCGDNCGVKMAFDSAWEIQQEKLDKIRETLDGPQEV